MRFFSLFFFFDSSTKTILSKRARFIVRKRVANFKIDYFYVMYRSTFRTELIDV